MNPITYGIGRLFKINLEYHPQASFCEIPRSIINVDEYLTKEFPANPGQPDGKGFGRYLARFASTKV